MGLYDSIYLKVKCPYCKETSKMEFQTKDGDYGMSVYKVGDKFQNGQFRKIDAIGSCDSFTCQFEASKESVWTMGYYGGFSRSFDVYIYCDSKGRITDKMRIYQLGFHKGIMKGILGELKGKDDNVKFVGRGWNGKRFLDGKRIPYKTDGWLNKFKEDSFDDGKNTYEVLLFLHNLKDSEEAMKIWFIYRYKLQKVIDSIVSITKIKEDDELASVFLSNKLGVLYEL